MSDSTVTETVVVTDGLGRYLEVVRVIDPYRCHLPSYDSVVLKVLSVREIGKCGYVTPPRQPALVTL